MTDGLVHIPTLRTERLVLRAPKINDLEAFVAYGQSPRSASVGGPFSRAESFSRMCSLIGHWQLRGFGRWLVADADDDTALGVVGLYLPEDWPEPEIAWTVFDSAEGKGIAFEAAQAARTYAYKTLGWTTAISCIEATNTRSQSLAERLGCKQDGIFPHPEYGTFNVWRHPAPEALA